ncbi:MAG: competence/damage-inducible protein A [Armatimonadota bacterium]
MIAEIVCVGTELLLGQVVDTNATYLSQVLASLGIDVYHKSTVGDNFERLVDTIRLAASRSDMIITSGGLGPTMDDLTKEAAAKAFGVKLVEDPKSASRIKDFFARRGLPVPDSNLKQALVFEGGMAIPNPIGTAPGALLRKNGKILICLPGPPRELVPMVEEHVVPYLRDILGTQRKVLRSRTLRLVGIGESMAEQMVADLIRDWNPTVAPLLSGYEVHFRITASGSDPAQVEDMIARKEAQLRNRLGDYVYGADNDTLESVVVRLLIERGLTIAVAESCTGGLVGHRITNVPGSSRTFLCGVTAYANEAKVQLLDVRPDSLNGYGAVSEQVAREMSEGIRRRAGSDLGVGITGIAGPHGGSAAKPVGLVYVSIATADSTRVSEHRFHGTREDIKQRAAQAALDAVRRTVISSGQH